MIHDSASYGANRALLLSGLANTRDPVALSAVAALLLDSSDTGLDGEAPDSAMGKARASSTACDAFPFLLFAYTFITDFRLRRSDSTN